MKIELFLDEDVHSGLAHALRKRGYDAIHTQELDRKGLVWFRSASICHSARTMSFYFQCERFCDPPQPACKKPTRTLGDHCFKTTPIQWNDVKIVTPASAYCQRNNEESFGVFVDYLGHSIYVRTKIEKLSPNKNQSVESSYRGTFLFASLLFYPERVKRTRNIQ